MIRDWTIKDLEYWDARIREKVEEFGLTVCEQEFEVCDHEQMLGYMAYHGMPSHYPHWSYGKAYEKLRTLYSYGVSGLPYEMVINANPALAYLMRDNSACLQVLTIAHVYGHNDFFMNNYMFKETHPHTAIADFKLRAERIRRYIEDPSIGLTQVEDMLDAAHALGMQCRRNFSIRRLTESEQRERAWTDAQPRYDAYARIHRPQETRAPDLKRVPLEPEEDILSFIADHNPYLTEWQRDLLHIANEETRYFIPQIETKIMNEGWASYWHHRIMNSLDLPEDLYLEFLVHHNQVLRPHPGGLNPYHVGFKIWQDIKRRFDAPTAEEIERYGAPDKSGDAKQFEVREADRDISFLRRFLTEELMREMDLFEYKQQGDKYVVSNVSDEENWEKVKQTLLRGIGLAGMPVIRILDADYNHKMVLLLEHDFDGRTLQLEYLEKTLGYVHRLWGRQVLLRTQMGNKPVVYSCDGEGFGRLKS